VEQQVAAGMVLLVSGPSGVGKSTFVSRLLPLEPALTFSVSTTTRPPRPGETQGVEYDFVSDAEFDRLVAAGAFVEWAHVHAHRYGTRRERLEEAMAAGRVPLLDVDVQGGQQVIRLFKDELVSVFLFPPSWDVLVQRLRSRGTEDEADFQVRLENARREIACADRYTYWLVNDVLESAVDRLRAILTAERCRRIRFDTPPVGG
jgi:guanylate kinase